MTLKTRIFTHHPRVSLVRFTLCWWRHNRLAMTSQWPDHCDANTWQVISNSLDIDIILGDIYGRSCKNCWYHTSMINHQSRWTHTDAVVSNQHRMWMWIVARCQWGSKEHASMKLYLKFNEFHSRTYTWKYRLWSNSYFVPASMFC